MDGRFTKSMLKATVWRNHNGTEQELLLSMMISCGICFQHREPRNEEPAVYFAPELLPDRTKLASKIDAALDRNAPHEHVAFHYPLLHPGLIRAIISRLGQQARDAADYWRAGLVLFEAKTRAHAVIESVQPKDAWAGALELRTQGGQAATLLRELGAVVLKEAEHLGLKGEIRSASPGWSATEFHDKQPRADVTPSEVPPSPDYERPRAPGAEWYISYAWGSNTPEIIKADPEAARRHDAVNTLCAEAESRFITIRRDINELGFGDSITAFMKRIGAADRVIVLLSEKYLQSAFCMYELFEIWRHSRGDTENFLGRVRLFSLLEPIEWKITHRHRRAIYWGKERDELRQSIKELGIEALPLSDLKEFQLINEYYQHVAEILAAFSDIVRYTTIEQLVSHCFDDPSPTPQNQSKP